MVLSLPCSAAERLSIRASGGQRAIDVGDLAFFVRTGEIPRSLKWYADRLTERELAGLRDLLQETLNVTPRTVSTFVNDTAGEALLRRLNGLFWGGTPESNFKALRSALVLAAYDDEGLTLLNVIHKYPLRDLRINLDSVIQASNDLDDILLNSKSIFAYIRQKGATGFTSDEALLANLPDPRQPGSFEWSRTTVEITNPVRDPGEEVAVDIYFPKNLEEPAPLVVISHGLASNRNTFAYLAEHLASQGYAVAAIEHPTTDATRYQQYIAGFEKEPETEVAIRRPLDITALLDYLEQQATIDPAWEGKVRTDRIGLVGHSLGGYTALAAGGAQFDFDYLNQVCSDSKRTILPFNLSLLLQCQVLELPAEEYEIADDRVAAILAINPIGSALFGPDGFSQIQIPTMIIVGSNDFFAPAMGEQVNPFTWLTNEHRYLVLVENGTHFSFLPGDRGEDVFNLPQ
ncbi:MAG: alpha/beta hydrolase [Synechococcus sp.]